MTRAAGQQAYKQAGISPSDLQVIELHDCCESGFVSLDWPSSNAFELATLRLHSIACTDYFHIFPLSTVAANELLVYDALGLTGPGKGHLLARNGANTYGGQFVINPSGGLESKGHPLGATGLGMVSPSFMAGDFAALRY